MYCARCGRVFKDGEPFAWSVLPGGTKLVSVCYDDRLCRRPIMGHALTPRMQRVREIAQRYVMKGVS